MTIDKEPMSRGLILLIIIAAASLGVPLAYAIYYSILLLRMGYHPGGFLP